MTRGTYVKIVFYLVNNINPYSAQPNEKTRENEVICDNDDYKDFHGMYLSLGHFYELKSPHNSFYINICLNETMH
jgi:hypothetical protein